MAKKISTMQYPSRAVTLTVSEFVILQVCKQKNINSKMWRNGKTWESSSRINSVSSFCICSFNLRGFSKNDSILQLKKLLTATKFQDIISLLDTHLNKEEGYNQVILSVVVYHRRIAAKQTNSERITLAP